MIERFCKHPTEISDYYLMWDGKAYIISEEIEEATENGEQRRTSARLFEELWKREHVLE